MKIIIINGPNLNLLGKREPLLYGEVDFTSFLETLKERHPGVGLTYVQSGSEGDLIEALHRAGDTADGVVLNPGAYSHTSIAIADAVRAVEIPVVEVHISNIYARESFRHKSFVSPVAKGVLAGFGLEGYALAIAFLVRNQKQV